MYEYMLCQSSPDDEIIDAIETAHRVWWVSHVSDVINSRDVREIMWIASKKYNRKIDNRVHESRNDDSWNHR